VLGDDNEPAAPMRVARTPFGDEIDADPTAGAPAGDAEAEASDDETVVAASLAAAGETAGRGEDEALRAASATAPAGTARDEQPAAGTDPEGTETADASAPVEAALAPPDPVTPDAIVEALAEAAPERPRRTGWFNLKKR
jgi:hypothetical protein